MMVELNKGNLLFGMKVFDATLLIKIFDHADTLTTVIILATCCAC